MLRRLAGVVAVIAMAAGCYWSVRLAIADQLASRSSPASLQHAISLAPDNPEYYLRLADVDPSSAPAAVKRAAELNPQNSSVWLELAQVAEATQDYPAAEKHLLHATRLDRTLAPRWFLTEFYFRRHDTQHFWPAVRAALAVSYDDVSPLLEVCWQIAADPARILDDAIPSRPGVLRQYLDFLLGQNRLDLADPVAKRLLQHPAADDIESLLAYCDLLLSKGILSPGLDTWNGLASQHLLETPQLDVERGRSLTNARFELPFLSRGFDWRLSGAEGVLAARRGSPLQLRLDFSGKQGENCEVLERFVPLMPARRYRMSVEYQTADLNGATGLEWRMLAQPSGANLLPAESLPAAQDAPASRQYVFSVPAGVHLARLTLEYHRVSGTVPIEGSLSLRAVELGFSQ